jgi:hypothetical protein
VGSDPERPGGREINEHEVQRHADGIHDRLAGRDAGGHILLASCAKDVPGLSDSIERVLQIH